MREMLLGVQKELCLSSVLSIFSRVNFSRQWSYNLIKDIAVFPKQNGAFSKFRASDKSLKLELASIKYLLCYQFALRLSAAF